MKINRYAIISYGTAVLLAVLLVVALFVVPEFLRIQENIHRLSCRTIERDIQSAIEEYNMTEPGHNWKPLKDIDLVMLLEKGCLDNYPVCPDRGVYRINESGEVYCTYHQPWKENQ